MKENKVTLYLLLLLLKGIAENNPQKFRLSVGEIETRKQFIRDTRQVVNVSDNLIIFNKNDIILTNNACTCIGKHVYV